jgi:YHS domain-containing protein
MKTVTLLLVVVLLLCLIAFSQAVVPHRLAQRFRRAQHHPALKEGDKTLCPVSGHQITITKDTPTYTWQGKIYYFCCSLCREKFIQNPQLYDDKPDTPEFLFQHPHN